MTVDRYENIQGKIRSAPVVTGKKLAVSVRILELLGVDLTLTSRRSEFVYIVSPRELWDWWA